MLAGLALSSTVGWWWADPVAALAIAAVAIRAGTEAWKEASEAATAAVQDPSLHDLTGH